MTIPPKERNSEILHAKKCDGSTVDRSTYDEYREQKPARLSPIFLARQQRDAVLIQQAAAIGKKFIRGRSKMGFILPVGFAQVYSTRCC
jgi:hypothetical protein